MVLEIPDLTLSEDKETLQPLESRMQKSASNRNGLCQSELKPLPGIKVVGQAAWTCTGIDDAVRTTSFFSLK
jgi:hypothetical protein